MTTNIEINEKTATEIARLAALNPLEYDRQRQDAAKRLNIRIETLDRAVKTAHDSKNSSGQGQAFSRSELEPWNEPVNGAMLLDELTETFKRFAVLPPHADTALALWVCFTWCIDAAQVAPIMAITSPEKRCGKTTVLSLLDYLTRSPLSAANISPSSLFRSIEKWQPTILIDEADTFIRESDEMRGILNSGHTRTTAFVIRNVKVGDDYEPRQFSTWAAKAIAIINKLPDTLHDRSVVLELRRKLVSESVEKLRHVDKSIFGTLCRKLMRFAQDNAEGLRNAKPLLPDDISDRAADNWEPLLAIAQLAGDEWVERALQAARDLSGNSQEVHSIGTELLADIEEIISVNSYQKIPSHHLMELLCEDSERPWATYNRGHRISHRQLAKILDEYGIHSKSIRLPDGKTPKGFERKQFEEAFSRYLRGSLPVSATAPQGADSQGLQVAPNTQKNDSCGVLKRASSCSISASCGGVAVKNTQSQRTGDGSSYEEDLSDADMDELLNEWYPQPDSPDNRIMPIT